VPHRAQEGAPDGEAQDGEAQGGGHRFGPRAEMWLEPFVQPWINAKDDRKERKNILNNILEGAKEEHHVNMCAFARATAARQQLIGSSLKAPGCCMGPGGEPQPLRCHQEAAPADMMPGNVATFIAFGHSDGADPRLGLVERDQPHHQAEEDGDEGAQGGARVSDARRGAVRRRARCDALSALLLL